MDPDQALTAFKELHGSLGDFARLRGRISEADTRANILDRIIHDVLGWPREAVFREVRCNIGWLDYELSKGITTVVIEAKAEGESFEIPHRKLEKAQRQKLNGALTSNTIIKDAIEQTQRYCNEKGIRFGVTTNGYSFIVFRGITQGASWREGNAYVFPSPGVIQADFTTFWNLLSYDAVRDGKLDEAFRTETAEIRETHRPIDEIVDSDATYARNSLNRALAPYVDKFFGDIASQDTIEVLKHCYVYSKPIQNIDDELDITIRDFIPRFAGTSQPVSANDVAQGGNIGLDLRESLSSGERKGAVVLLMGGIGAGKTTFLKRFFKVVAPDLIDSTGPAFHLYVNFLGAPDRLQELDNFFWRETSEGLRSQHPVLNQRSVLENVFKTKLRLIDEIYAGQPVERAKRISDEIFRLASDPKEFTVAALRYCSTTTRFPLIVLDNVDQLSVDIQTHIFTTAEHFANHLGCLCVLVIREESYSTAQMQKQLTAYNIRAYHLSSPSFRDLIQLRIQFATRYAVTQNDQPELGRENTSSGTAAGEILEFFRLLQVSVFNRNHNIMRLLEAISFGNMRFALSLFNNFITSGATNMPKILEKFREGGYNVPFHEFAKSVILGDYKFYSGARSLFGNLFRTTSARNTSHFTALRMLAYLSHSVEGAQSSEGFVRLQSLITTFVDLFDNENDCIKTIERLIPLNRQLVEVDTRRTDTLAGAQMIRITTSGKYYLNYLVNAFSYLDLVWHDTPFNDRGVSDVLSKLMHSSEMEDRFKRVEIFLSYLQREEDKEYALNPAAKDAFGGPIVAKVKAIYLKEKQHIIKRVFGVRPRYPNLRRRISDR